MEMTRKLDVAQSASVDKVVLNNEVVKMRGLIQQVRVHTIHKMTRKIEQLKKKKGTDEEKEKNKRKAQRLIDEIHFMKIMRRDNVTKYALGSTEKFEDVLKQPNLPMETKILARLANNRLLQKKVEEFRTEHPDWKALVEYLLTKNTSREYKKRKSKQPRGKARKSQPIKNNKGTSVKALTNIEAKDVLVNTYLEGKLRTSKQPRGGNSLASEIPAQSESGSDDGGSQGIKTSVKKSLVSSVKKGKAFSAKQQRKMKQELTKKSVESDSLEHSHSSDSGDGDVDNVEQDSNSNEESLNSEEISVSKLHSKRTGTCRRTKGSESKQKQKADEKSIDRGSILVKKINLDELNTSASEVKVDQEIPQILLTQSLKESQMKTKVKDPFFAGSDDDEGYDKDTVGCYQDDQGTISDNSDEIEDDFSEGRGTKRTLSTKHETEKGKKAFMSTFLGSLRNKEQIPFKRNEDWKRIRQEGRDQNQFGNRNLFNESGSRRGGFAGRGRPRDHPGSRPFSRFPQNDNRPPRGGKHQFGGEGFGERIFTRGRGRGRGGGKFDNRKYSQQEDRGNFSRKEERGGKHNFNKASSQKAAEKTSTAIGPVHPSWEASKKRKQEQGKIKAFEGKKIKFDD